MLRHILSIPSAEYHADSRSGRFMSSHLLGDFRESPALYHRKIQGQIAQNESSALALGRASHCLILEGRAAFEQQYVVADGPVNARTGEPYGKATKAYADWLKRQNREVLSNREYGFVSRLEKSVLLHDEALLLLEEGYPEGVMRTEYCGVPCQIRMDWLSQQRGLVDLKTCESLRWFENDCRKFGYLFQMAFYRAVIRLVTGVTVPVHFIAVEKTEPFSTGVWAVTSEVLDEAEKVNEGALRRYQSCLVNDIWPTGYEEIRVIVNL